MNYGCERVYSDENWKDSWEKRGLDTINLVNWI